MKKSIYPNIKVDGKNNLVYTENDSIEFLQKLTNI